ncbi:MAG: ribosomal RNA small subunit methyltransferase A, partial [Deltaproteobacteria bacterium]
MNRSLPALRRFGQNFLTDPNIRRKMVAALDIDPQDAVLEIGPGDGALTRPLMERARRVVAVEIDRGRCARLKESLPRSSRVRLICRDILETDIRGIASGCRRKRLIVFGNIPYNITSPLLVHLSGAAAS